MKKNEMNTIMTKLPNFFHSSSNGATPAITNISKARKSTSLFFVTAVWWKNGYFKAKNRSTLIVSSADVENPPKIDPTT
jgi:hypothetical protein